MVSGWTASRELRGAPADLPGISEEQGAVDEGHDPGHANENGRDHQVPSRADEDDRRKHVQIFEPPEIGLSPPNPGRK